MPILGVPATACLFAHKRKTFQILQRNTSLVRPILFNCLDEQLIWRQFKRPAGKTDQNLYACDGGADACVTALKELQPPTDWPTPWWTHNTHPHFHSRSRLKGKIKRGAHTVPKRKEGEEPTEGYI